jgi:hypothetical protein
MAAFSLRRIGFVLTGALLAGIGATLLQAVGVRPVYSVVVAIAGAMPVLLEGMRPAEGSVDTGTQLQYALVEIVGALAVGMFGAFALVLADVSQGILVGGATLAAYVGGFMARSAIRGGSDAEDVEDD